MENWYKAGMSGKKPAIPAEDVTWQTLPVLNHRIYKKYKGTELNERAAWRNPGIYGTFGMNVI